MATPAHLETMCGLHIDAFVQGFIRSVYLQSSLSSFTHACLEEKGSEAISVGIMLASRA